MVVDGSLTKREGEEIKAMNMSILPNAVGGAVFIVSNATPT
jgi:hypothetical protein